MTLSVSTQVSPVGTKLIKQNDADENANNDVTGTSGTIYMIELDNSGNPTETVYLKIYDSAAPTIGTTAPNIIVPAPANQRVTLASPEGLAFTNLSFCVVTTAGTAGSTGPSNTVSVNMITS